MSKRIFNVIEYIPTGKQNAIAMSELAKRSGISQREARKAVFKARCNGELICSVCNGDKSSGYYRPNNASEIRPYIVMQEHRIASAKAALKSAEEFLEGEENA